MSPATSTCGNKTCQSTWDKTPCVSEVRAAVRVAWLCGRVERSVKALGAATGYSCKHVYICIYVYVYIYRAQHNDV